MNVAYISGTDETVSDLFGAVVEFTRREWTAKMLANVKCLPPDGQAPDSILGKSGTPCAGKPG